MYVTNLEVMSSSGQEEILVPEDGGEEDATEAERVWIGTL